MDRDFVTYGDGKRLAATPLHAAIAPASVRVLTPPPAGGHDPVND
jgi:hypothetical protein